jgi:uncharacterized protein
MKTKLINDGPQKTYVLLLDKGDEAVGSIEGFAREKGIMAAQLTGIGAFSDAVLGFFDWETKEYRRIPVTEQVEVVSLLGDVALGPDDKPALHPHVVVSRADGIAMGRMRRAGSRSSQRRISGDVGPASYKDCNGSPAGSHDRRSPLGARNLAGTRHCRHDRRVLRLIGRGRFCAPSAGGQPPCALSFASSQCIHRDGRLLF